MMPARRFVWLALVLASLLLPGCAQLPPLGERSSSVALQDTAQTRIGRSVGALVQAHPGRSGLIALADGRDAFAARVRLAEVAERSLDVQYYIWHDDMSGTLLFDALRRAADRGVRVRLLLDDNNTAALDGILAALDAHPNIELRLFNPFAIRNWRVLGYLGDFPRLNRRMHNKSFTADNQATIIGGRNVGDEYFGAGRARCRRTSTATGRAPRPPLRRACCRRPTRRRCRRSRAPRRRSRTMRMHGPT